MSEAPDGTAVYTAVPHIPLDFENRLQWHGRSGAYVCPACGNPTLSLDRANPQNVLLVCTSGCTQQEILRKLSMPPLAILTDPAWKPNPNKRRLTWRDLQGEIMQRGWRLRQNVITGNIDAEEQPGKKVFLDDMLADLFSDLGDTYTGVTLQALPLYMARVARENKYNPVLDCLSDFAWDGKDRIGELYALLGIQEDDLSRTLLKKWLLQTVALLFNGDGEPYGADGVLVLNGPQGSGKTSLFRRLALRPDWFREGAIIKDNDKDTLRRCVTSWIVELGEVESTLKSDVEALKAFVTSAKDAYRLPYGRSDIEAPRRASLCATCNSDAYLLDLSGNRRWFTVPVSRVIPYEEIQAFNAEQLWAQIYAIVSTMNPAQQAACFRLTSEDRKQLEERNGGFVKPVKAEDEVRDILDAAKEKGYVFQLMTVTEWKDQHDTLRHYSAQQISTALKQCGVIQRQKRLNGSKSPSRVYELPTRSSTDNPFPLQILK